MFCGSLCGNAGTIPNWCGKKKVEPQGESLDSLVYVPTHSYGHEVWVVTERTGSWIQAVEIRFLQQMDDLSLRDRVSLGLDKLEL